MTDKNSKTVGQALQKIAQKQDTEELFYDPRSGIVEVIKKGEVVHDDDRVPATEMAREGFFRWFGQSR